MEGFKKYYDSGYLKFKEVMTAVLKLADNISNVQIIDINGKIVFDSKDLSSDSIPDAKASLAPANIIEAASKDQPSFFIDSEHRNRVTEIIYPYRDEWGVHTYA